MRRSVVALFSAGALVSCGGADVPAPIAPEELLGKDSLAHPVSRAASTGATATAPPATATPPASTSAASSQPSNEPKPSDLEAMIKAVAVIKSAVPKWDQGAAAAIQFRNLQTKETSTVLLERHRAPQEAKGRFHVYVVSESASAWVAINAREFKPGDYECTSLDFMLAVATTPDFKGDDPKTMWADNKGGSCHIRVFKPSETPEDRELTFKGKFVSNDGTASFEITDGYLYLRRAPTATVPAGASAGSPPAVRSVAPKANPAENTPRLKLPR